MSASVLVFIYSFMTIFLCRNFVEIFVFVFFFCFELTGLTTFFPVSIKIALLVMVAVRLNEWQLGRWFDWAVFTNHVEFRMLLRSSSRSLRCSLLKEFTTIWTCNFNENILNLFSVGINQIYSPAADMTRRRMYLFLQVLLLPLVWVDVDAHQAGAELFEHPFYSKN